MQLVSCLSIQLEEILVRILCCFSYTMLAARLALFTTAPVATLARLTPKSRPDLVRQMANEARTGVRPTHATRRRTLKEIAMQPTSGTPFRYYWGTTTFSISTFYCYTECRRAIIWLLGCKLASRSTCFCLSSRNFFSRTCHFVSILKDPIQFTLP
jgi:hypothetical protein